MDKNGAWVRLLLSTLREEGCTKSAAVILAVVADRATESATRSCRASQKELATAAGVDVRTVRRAVEQLERLGLLEVSRQLGGESVYKLTAAVELPAKQRTTEQQRAAAAARAKKAAQAKRLEEYAAAAEIHSREMRKYEMGPEIEAQEAALAMSLVNRFKEG